MASNHHDQSWCLLKMSAKQKQIKLMLSSNTFFIKIWVCNQEGQVLIKTTLENYTDKAAHIFAPVLIHNCYLITDTGKSSFNVKTPTVSKTFGERSEKVQEATVSSDFQSDLSDIERTLLQSYPGESKHLDDSQDHIVSDIFYYTEWDDPIYDQFQDYDYEDKLELAKAEETKEPEKAAFEPAKEQVSESSTGDIRIDLNKYPQRLPRKTQGKVPNPGTPAKRCHDDKCKLPDCHCGGADVPGE